MKHRLGVGIIGCGNISGAYFQLAPLFRGIEVRACADINPDTARKMADAHGVRSESVEALLQADDIDIVVNLTIPSAHYDVSKAAVDKGKHVYSEKPFVLSVKEGRDLLRRAARRNVRIGSAPDTFLGGSHQLARKLVDSGRLGQITSGSCHVMSHGMESWHPNPDFFFLPGAGPVLDIGPYYVTNLINLIGPVSEVVAKSVTPASERVILSKPRRGEKIPVKTPTTVHALLEFGSGALITFGASWDVWHHAHRPMELYGETGTLHVPDPNFFGGEIGLTKREEAVETLPAWDHPFGVANHGSGENAVANYRASGLADLADAILKDRPHRCSAELALHAVDVMTSILKSGESGRPVRLNTTCTRPEPLPPAKARALMVKR